MAFIDSFTPIMSSISRLKGLTGYNEIIGLNDFDVPKYTTFYNLRYGTLFTRNVNFMVSVQCFAIVMYIIYRIAFKRCESRCKKTGKDP